MTQCHPVLEADRRNKHRHELVKLRGFIDVPIPWRLEFRSEGVTRDIDVRSYTEI